MQGALCSFQGLDMMERPLFDDDTDDNDDDPDDDIDDTDDDPGPDDDIDDGANLPS